MKTINQREGRSKSPQLKRNFNAWFFISDYGSFVRLNYQQKYSAGFDYISNHSDAVFSHGICPDCIAEHYPDLL